MDSGWTWNGRKRTAATVWKVLVADEMKDNWEGGKAVLGSHNIWNNKSECVFYVRTIKDCVNCP